MSDNKDHNSDSDSDGAPEEFTQEQAQLEDAELRKIHRENKARFGWPREERESRKVDTFDDIEEEEEHEEDPEALANKGFLSKNIIDFLAQREKHKNSSDSEEEEANKEHPRKKKRKSSGIETVIYKEIPPPECLKTGLDFLKKRKAQVPRSSSILNNSSQALRLVTAIERLKEEASSVMMASNGKLDVGQGSKLENDNKKNWMSSAQLWISNSNSTNKEEDRRVTQTCNNLNQGGSFTPFNPPMINCSRTEQNHQFNSRTEQNHQFNKPHHIPKKEQRRRWSQDLHRRFVDALRRIGGSQVATPKQIRDEMKVDGLTNDEVKSHLQKYRMHIRKHPLSSSDQPRETQSLISLSRSGSPQSPLVGRGLFNNNGSHISEDDEEEEKSDGRSWRVGVEENRGGGDVEEDDGVSGADVVIHDPADGICAFFVEPKEAIPYCQKALLICKARMERLTNEIKGPSASATSSTVSEIEEGIQQSSNVPYIDKSASDKEAEIGVLSGLAEDLEKKASELNLSLEDLKQQAENPKQLLAELMGMASAKPNAGDKVVPAVAREMSSSRMGTANNGKDLESPTVSTAHTGAAGGGTASSSGVTHLGVVGRGVKRVLMNATSAESSPAKKLAPESSNKADGNSS
ncbi:hypothetical protein F2Q70_00012967 [Brassica cretica]|uniref:HTH myb-type domain-containing protein n=2 Tax=Brassica cretica TaxID=69181 RepID=A0A8S9MG38_BRACR|nr:hypothetical protein F2Q70_00012967 [Brassica cretica]